eukprot:c16317_g1_i1.p1 GENE.c16317_g1_i1~~c16317_g1_i1.p1  ORF type:complete len:241 (-),score=60.10 c16317_g1_i1:1-642(-)
MSCSDKILRWLCLGIQGALLSTLIPLPITFASITTSGPATEESLNRAFVLRLPEHVVPPKLFLLKENRFECNRQSNRSSGCGCAVIWCDQLQECVLSASGRLRGFTKQSAHSPKSQSIVCKRKLADKFIETLSLCINTTALSSPNIESQPPQAEISVQYQQLKQNALCAAQYTAKLEFFKRFSNWVRSPPATSSFDVAIPRACVDILGLKDKI